MNKKRRFLILLLVFAMAIMPLFVTGCKKKGDDDVDRVDAEGDLPPSFGGKQKEYGGKKFRVLSHEDRQKDQAFNIVDLVPNEELGDEAINVSVEARNTKIKKYFGVSIVRDTVPQGELKTKAANVCQQMSDDYSVFRLRLNQALEIALTGGLVDLNEESWIDLSQDWWDDGITDSLLLYEGAYFGLGDICTVDDDATWVVLFNKKIYEETEKKEAKELYNLVKNGNWTIDYMKTLSQAAARPETNESIHIYDKDYTGGGRYGLTLQWAVAEAIMVSNNKTITKYNSEDPLMIDEVGANDLFSAVESMFKFMGGTNATAEWLLVAEKTQQTAGEDVYSKLIRPMFMADRSLFFICHVGTIGLIRDMETDFGILPMPKIDSSVAEYGNTVQYNCADCYVIPNIGKPKEAEFAAYILEALAYYSSSEYDEKTGDNTSLTYAYYETVLKRKASRDNDSAQMLDLIFENRIFDIAYALNLKGISGVISSTMQSDNNNFTSKYAEISPSGQGIYNALAKSLENLKDK